MQSRDSNAKRQDQINSSKSFPSFYHHHPIFLCSRIIVYLLSPPHLRSIKWSVCNYGSYPFPSSITGKVGLLYMHMHSKFHSAAYRSIFEFRSGSYLRPHNLWPEMSMFIRYTASHSFYQNFMKLMRIYLSYYYLEDCPNWWKAPQGGLLGSRWHEKLVLERWLNKSKGLGGMESRVIGLSRLVLRLSTRRRYRLASTSRCRRKKKEWGEKWDKWV